MTITNNDVADLDVGDVVEVTWPNGTVLRGPLGKDSAGRLALSPMTLRHPDGGATLLHCDATLRVIRKAPTPFYVNHPRTNPVWGDIVRDAEGDAWRRGSGGWFMAGGQGLVEDITKYAPLTLLWDSEKGRVVP